MRLLLGGYTADMGGEAAGIGLLHAGDPDGATADGQLSLRPEVVAASSPIRLVIVTPLPVRRMPCSAGTSTTRPLTIPVIFELPAFRGLPRDPAG